MPDPPPSKRRRRPTSGAVRAPSRCAYAELHAKTNFSFLRGASHPDELVEEAARLGYRALAITDENSLAGVVRAHTAARDSDLALLIGAEITPVDAPPAVLLAVDRAGYGRLSRLITCGRRRVEKGACYLTFDDLAVHADGLLACVLLAVAGSAEVAQRAAKRPPAADRQSSGTPSRQIDLFRPRAADEGWLARYREVFGDRCYALAELHYGGDDARQLQRMIELARRAQVPLAASGDVHYHRPDRQMLQDVLTAIRAGCTVAEAGERLFANAERHLKPPEEMYGRFAAAPEAVARTVEIAGRCHFSLDELRYEYPEELCPPGLRPIDHLTELAWRGAHKRYPAGIPQRVRRQIEHELRLIEELCYEAYFLTVWDLVRFARSQNILCQGRGSAANSAVCYCLGVTAVDPDRIDLLFERFVSRERNEAPDIDVDFEHLRREEVLQYVYEKYGRDRAGMTAEVITYRPRSAVRDVGKALGLSLARVDALAKALDGYGDAEGDKLYERLREAGLEPHSPLARQLLELVRQLLGFPRHLSQHVGGMVITRGSLCELVPIENAAMPERTVIQWDKDDLDELGILKVDCLALGMLTAIHKCFDLVREHHGRKLSLAAVPPGDHAVYDMICHADTMGVFQIESRAQMSMLPRLRPRCFYDLVIEVAIVRPGPIQGNMVHPYLRRRAGKEGIEYPNDEIRAVLHKTLGVPIFQEQAMRLAVVAAGFTPGEADQLRRAMGGWRRPGLIEQFRQRLIEGMRSRGLPEEFAGRVFEQIRGFGEYGFPESHAASFALLVYVSAWLKHYYPAAFAAALLNSQPMGFYAPAQLVRDTRAHDVDVRRFDVGHSRWDCTLEESDAADQPALRLGLRMVRGLPAAVAEAIEQARAAGPFRSLEDFARRSRLGRAVVARLARADAFDSLALDRRAALWLALAQEQAAERFPLLAGLDADEPPVVLPAMPEGHQVVADYQAAGLTLRAHPLSFIRAELTRRRAAPASELATRPANRMVCVAGLVLLRQRPSTARGVTFVTLEDETGQANLLVRRPVWERYHHAARNSTVMLATGMLEREGEVIHVLVTRIEDISPLLAEVRTRSRDFR